MKKLGIILLAISSIILIGCTIQGQNTIQGTKIININLSKTQKIIYRNFDQSTIIQKDKEAIQEICSLIQKANYKIIEDDLEGMYLMELVTDKETISIGFDQRHISYNDQLYECCDDTDLSLILKLLGIENDLNTDGTFIMGSDKSNKVVAKISQEYPPFKETTLTRFETETVVDFIENFEQKKFVEYTGEILDGDPVVITVVIDDKEHSITYLGEKMGYFGYNGTKYVVEKFELHDLFEKYK